MQRPQDEAALTGFLDLLDPAVRHAVEVRHRSWHDHQVYEALCDRGVALAWPQTADLATPTVATTDLLYLRVIGDRSLTTFGRVQRDRSAELRQWHGELEGHLDRSSLALFFVDNHFAGFGPATANEVRVLAGQAPATLPLTRDADQRSLTDFSLPGHAV